MSKTSLSPEEVMDAIRDDGDKALSRNRKIKRAHHRLKEMNMEEFVILGAALKRMTKEMEGLLQ